MTNFLSRYDLKLQQMFEKNKQKSHQHNDDVGHRLAINAVGVQHQEKKVALNILAPK